jgi:hypothetical protein
VINELYLIPDGNIQFFLPVLTYFRGVVVVCDSRTGLIWLRMGTSGGLFKHGHETSGSINGGEFDYPSDYKLLKRTLQHGINLSQLPLNSSKPNGNLIIISAFCTQNVCVSCDSQSKQCLI